MQKFADCDGNKVYMKCGIVCCCNPPSSSLSSYAMGLAFLPFAETTTRVDFWNPVQLVVFLDYQGHSGNSALIASFSFLETTRNCKEQIR
jgi:hypothetical protein